MGYRTRLDSLDYSKSLAMPTDARVILLTGQSSFRSSRLSTEQADFLNAVAPPDACPLLAGFPYHPDFDRDEPTPNLPTASMRNALQFLWSLWSPAYQQSVARALQPVFTNTRSTLAIVTGSCGLQLLASAWPMLTVPGPLTLRVVALGPAMLRSAAFDPGSFAAIRGHSDTWSRLLYRGPVAAHCATGHLDYWTSKETRELVARLLREETV